MGQQALATYSLETYLQLETQADTKYEYYDGFIVAMAGGSPKHGELTANMITALNNQLRAAKKGCKTFSSDVKIALPMLNRRFYPDLSVVCGPVQYDKTEPNALTNPLLVVEVLSPSTESLDRGEKFRAYRQLPSLREYILVSEDRAVVEVFSRTERDTWRIQSAIGTDQTFEIPALGIEIQTSDVYYGIEDFSEELP
jgi:Uma2 family endonuclease